MFDSPIAVERLRGRAERLQELERQKKQAVHTIRALQKGRQRLRLAPEVRWRETASIAGIMAAMKSAIGVHANTTPQINVFRSMSPSAFTVNAIIDLFFELYLTEAAFCNSGARPYFWVAYPTIKPTMPPGSMIWK